MDAGDIGLGGLVGVEQVDLLVGQDFGLLLGKAVLGQMLDEPMGVKGNRFMGGSLAYSKRTGQPLREPVQDTRQRECDILHQSSADTRDSDHA